MVVECTAAWAFGGEQPRQAPAMHAEMPIALAVVRLLLYASNAASVCSTILSF